MNSSVFVNAKMADVTLLQNSPQNGVICQKGVLLTLKPSVQSV